MRTFTCRSTFLYAQKSLQKSKNSAEFRVGGIPWTPYLNPLTFIPPYGAQVVTSVVDVPEEVCDLKPLTFIPHYVAQVVTSVVDIPEEVCDLNTLTFIPHYVA